MASTHVRDEILTRLENDLPAIEAKLRPAVVRIRYSVGDDWSGDPSIFFRVVISDSATQGAALAEVTGSVRARLFDDLGLGGMDYIPYFNFRGQSEQEALKDPEWE